MSRDKSSGLQTYHVTLTTGLNVVQNIVDREIEIGKRNLHIFIYVNDDF